LAWAHKCRQGLALWRHKIFLKGNALIARQDGLTDPNQAIAIPHRGWDIGNLIPTRLALLDAAPQTLEGFQEEGFDIVRLQAARFCAFHIFSDTVHA
jgi:hypothetical protein